jgi:hypothetical protein
MRNRISVSYHLGVVRHDYSDSYNIKTLEVQTLSRCLKIDLRDVRRYLRLYLRRYLRDLCRDLSYDPRLTPTLTTSL